jgi:hypothetical protein
MAEQGNTQQTFTAKDMMDFAANLARELKKPSDEEQAKKDADHKRLLANQQNSISEAAATTRQKEAGWASCSHMKPHPYQGKTRIVAPFHSDGLFHPICLNCQKEFAPFPAGNQTIPVGASFDDYQGVTPQLIESWGKRHAETQKQLVSA